MDCATTPTSSSQYCTDPGHSGDGADDLYGFALRWLRRKRNLLCKTPVGGREVAQVVGDAQRASDKVANVKAEVAGSLLIGWNTNGEIQTSNAFLTHFAPANEEPPVEGALYFVGGKIASIDRNFDVGDGAEWTGYDFIIDADVMRLLPQDGCYSPFRPVLTVAGTRIAHHMCHLPPSNRRFTEKIPLPAQGKTTQVIGSISTIVPEVIAHEPVKPSVKRLIVGVSEISMHPFTYCPSTDCYSDQT
ncbi:hypothetical protein DFH94DRAFT_678336 [Russula ochroleuca]|uniref:Uncharacterized protein n=1 Tax=Russula ochroleuca TaxID=152965 RepID=A0A9P5TEQ1_9AGAM|nr:hypothetical protein DFH94DRAFT_678336 [Russula ochroleuca]